MNETYITVMKKREFDYSMLDKGDIIKCRKSGLNKQSASAYYADGIMCGKVTGIIKPRKECFIKKVLSFFPGKYYAEVVFCVSDLYVCRLLPKREAAQNKPAALRTPQVV